MNTFKKKKLLILKNKSPHSPNRILLPKNKIIIKKFNCITTTNKTFFKRKPSKTNQMTSTLIKNSMLITTVRIKKHKKHKSKTIPIIFGRLAANRIIKIKIILMKIIRLFKV